MRKLPVLLLSMTACSVLAYNLDEVLNLSRERDPGYQSKMLKFAANKKAAVIAIGKSLPALTLSLTGTQTSTAPNVTARSSKLKLASTIPLYNPENLHTHRAGKIETEKAQLDERSFQTTHILSIAESYFAALSAQETYQSNLTATKRYQKSYEESLELEKAGLKTHVDTLVSLSAYDNSQVDAVSAKNQLSHTLNTLEGKIDASVGTLNTYQQEIIPDLPVEPIETLISHALTQGSKLAKARLSLKTSNENLSHAESRFLPSLTLTIGMSQTLAQLQEGFLHEDHTDVETSLAVSMNVFNGFSDYHRVRQKALSYQASLEELKNETYNIKLDIEKSYQDFTNTKLKASASLSAMKSSKASLDAVSEQYQAGTTTELELLTAISRNTSSQQGYYESIYQYFQSYLKLKASASMLNDTAVADISQLLRLETDLQSTTDPS